MFSAIVVARSPVRPLVATLLLVLCSIPLAALPQRSAPSSMSGMGSFIIHVNAVDGSPLPPAVVTLFTDIGESTGNNPSRLQDATDFYYQFSGVLPGRYVIEVSVPGYQDSKQLVELTNANLNEAIMFFLKPIGADKNTPDVPPSAVFTPRAQKETQNALRDLQSKKYESAQKHLTVAVAASPGNAQINFLLGMTYIWLNHAPEGKPYLEKAVSLNPKHVDSLLALGNLRYRDGDFAGTIELLDRAVKISDASWQTQLMLAQSNLKLNNYTQARDHAERASELGREKASGAQIVLAQALAGLGDNQQSATVLKAFLQTNPQDANAEKIRSWIVELERPVPAEVSTAPSVAPSAVNASDTIPAPNLPVVAVTKDTWTPPDSDATVPTVVSGRACSLPKVLSGASKRAEELVAHLEQFSAVEKFESVEIRGNGQLSEPASAAFEYLVFIHSLRPGSLNVQEVREQNKVVTSLPNGLQDMGSPGIALLFLPQYQEDFELKCEGLGQWNGQATWLVHFQQRSDRPVRLRKFVTEAKEYPLSLRGRAWISAESSQVLHMETDLMAPVPEVQFRREHMSVDYQLVPFPNHKMELWLPQQVDIYFDFRGHYYHRYHKLSDFKLTAVDVQHKVSKPK